jgi:hypothetical protein
VEKSLPWPGLFKLDNPVTLGEGVSELLISNGQKIEINQFTGPYESSPPCLLLALSPSITHTQRQFDVQHLEGHHHGLEDLAGLYYGFGGRAHLAAQ